MSCSPQIPHFARDIGRRLNEIEPRKNRAHAVASRRDALAVNIDHAQKDSLSHPVERRGKVAWHGFAIGGPIRQ
jgi:hypothetical protein